MKEQEHKHFLHPHPLQYTNTPPKEPNTTCSSCKLTLIQGNYYHKCQTCPDFSLHQICYNMPQIARHQSDPAHVFTLRPAPSSSSSSPLCCNACTNKIDSFHYNCHICQNYYHIFCLAAPVSVRAPSHPHMLSLEFSPPYEFGCDICQKPHHQGWLYRCGMCEFDVHFACAISAKNTKWIQQQVTLPLMDDVAIKRQELMELLTRGVDRIGEGTDSSTINNGSSSGVEERSFLSCQLSDACFSIDFAKSLLGNNEMDDGKGSTEKGKDSSFNGVNVNGYNNNSKNGIGSHIWKELDPETEKRNVNGGIYKKTESTKSDNVRLKCLCWSKVLLRN